jgi:membrane associated rhomboid family serine protease
MDSLTLHRALVTISIHWRQPVIPIRDSTKSRTIPFVNYLIIGSCGLIFFYELSLGPALERFIYRYGLVPAELTSTLGGQFSLKPFVSILTSMFIHGGWMHVIGNMLFLYVFGDNVEDRLGHTGYLVFYLLCGIGAALSQVYFSQTSESPMIGASGAIAGVLGAYFLLFPRARVLTIIPLFVFFPVVEVSAFFFLGVWFILQFVQGSLVQGTDASGGVAWWAHAGGFLVGAALLPIFLLAKRT